MWHILAYSDHILLVSLSYHGMWLSLKALTEQISVSPGGMALESPEAPDDDDHRWPIDDPNMLLCPAHKTSQDFSWAVAALLIETRFAVPNMEISLCVKQQIAAALFTRTCNAHAHKHACRLILVANSMSEQRSAQPTCKTSKSFESMITQSVLAFGSRPQP